MTIPLARNILKAALMLVFLACMDTQILAQQPGFPPQPGAPPRAQPGQPAATATAPPGQYFYRVIFPTFEQYSYGEHPFPQLTGSTEFSESQAGRGGIANIGIPESDHDSGVVDKLLHALPPFGFERGWHTPEYPFPKSISIGVDFVQISQRDLDAVSLAQIETAELPRFEMDSYYLGIPVRFYGLAADTPGINYFVGFSLGTVSGKLLVRNSDPSVADIAVPFKASSVGAARVGIDVGGKNFGARYELMMIRARRVKFGENPFPGQSTETSIDFSGTVLRIGMFFRF